MNRFVKKAKKYREGFAPASQTIEAIIESGSKMLYNNFVDRCVPEYIILMLLEMMTLQISINFISYNANIDSNNSKVQLISKRLVRSGESSKILSKGTKHDINYLMHNESESEPVPCRIDVQASSSLTHKILFNPELENTIVNISRGDNKVSHRMSLAKLRLKHLKQYRPAIVTADIGNEEVMQLHEEGCRLKQLKLNEQSRLQEEQQRRDLERKKELAFK